VFEQVANFRDLGGLRTHSGSRVRPGLLYRSASIDWMTEADASVARDVLGLRTVIDLRAAHEVTHRSEHPLLGGAVERVHAPLSNAAVEAGWACVPPYGVESYVLSLEHARTAVRDAIESLAGPGALPALVHCAAGKDRTGILVALILDLLGVPEREIEADYCASASQLERVSMIAGRGEVAVLDRGQLEVFPASLRGTLDWVRDRFGGSEAYLLVCGVAPVSIRRLRAELLE
jgi:protein-tyrosine phosphatase